jgi:hypothetical protein
MSERRREEGEDAMMTEAGAKPVESDVVADTPMAEVTETPLEGQTPRVTIDEPIEERVAAEEGEAEDKMDTT